ncbi:hypothetical protein BX666DRAFT_1847120 [Dichotomocladium elegans]|nr:hypothetical protein BX666DRAFT_1847120 [Dichotomocladium elegans]
MTVLYKTEYCRNWAELGYCRYGKKCRYAHGLNELRAAPRHSRYKTSICHAYHVEGTCPYGIRCTYIHDLTGSLTAPGLLSSQTHNYWSSLPIPSARTDSRFFRRSSLSSSVSLSSSSSTSTVSSSPSSPFLQSPLLL